ncbi:MAG: hypothetical protein PWR01_3733 [Clostridiales bacterium]|nr:hypothetical protein [Clostridiales bacterium]MDN5282660.1 hypothetical protein [Candidatus Ozemobacter sp.]
MKKSLFFVLLTVILMVPQAAHSALSLEAKEMVEELRRGLKATTSSVTIVAKDAEDYEVGEELAKAIRRLRVSIYGTPEPTNVAYPPRNRFKNIPEGLNSRTERFARVVHETSVPELYVPGIMLRTAIDRVKATRQPYEISTEVVAPEPVEAVNTEKVVAADATKEAPIEKPVVNVAHESMAAPEKIAPVKKAQKTAVTARKKTSRKRIVTSAPEKPRSEVFKSEASKKVRVQKADFSSSSSKKVGVASKADSSFDDLKINREIEKREFRMPGNYRIIVR